MSYHKHITGARTRNVVNLVDPGNTVGVTVGGTDDLVAAIGAPTTSAHGYKNFHSQKNLHLVIKNDDLKDNSNGNPSLAAAMTLSVKLYVYNSSLGGEWTELSLPMSSGTGAGVLEFYTVPTIQVASGGTFRTILPIEGAERIAVGTTITGGNGTRGSGTYSIWLGANSIT